MLSSTQSYRRRLSWNSSVHRECVIPSSASLDAVGKVVHRVDAPLVASLVVFSKLNAVQHRIAHHDKRRSHVDLRTQAGFTFFKTAGTHFLEQRQVLFNAAVAVRAVFTRLRQGAAVFADLFRCQFINVRQAFIDQFDRIGVELIKIIGGVTGRYQTSENLTTQRRF